MNTVIRDGPTAIAASVEGTIAPTVRPIADAANDSIVTMPQNFANLNSEFHVKGFNELGQVTRKDVKSPKSHILNKKVMA